MFSTRRVSSGGWSVSCRLSELLDIFTTARAARSSWVSMSMKLLCRVRRCRSRRSLSSSSWSSASFMRSRKPTVPTSSRLNWMR